MFYVNGAETRGPADWICALKSQEKHWKPGYSAWELAYCWEAANGFPPEIQRVLAPRFPDVEMLKGLVEHRVGLPGRGGASHNDLFVIACAAGETLCIAVEGKVAEKFGPRLQEWHTGSANKETRLVGLCDLIGLDRATIPDTIRYQLLHRMASPVIAAESFDARHAIMIIHSFSDLDESFDDFTAFLRLYGKEAVQPDTLFHLKTIDDVNLYAGWARGIRRGIDDLPAGDC